MLLSNIAVCFVAWPCAGGNTLFPGFVDRLHNDIYYELDRMQPNLGSKLRIISPQTPIEQQFRCATPHKNATQRRGPALCCVLVCTHRTFTKGRSIFSRSTKNGPAFP